MSKFLQLISNTSSTPVVTAVTYQTGHATNAEDSIIKHACSIISILDPYNYCVLDVIHRPILLFKTQRSVDWILSPSSGKNLLSCAQSIDLVANSGPPTSSIDYVQLSRFLLDDSDRSQSSERCTLNKKTKAIDNIQKHIILLTYYCHTHLDLIMSIP
jgi:hypothetical protein